MGGCKLILAKATIAEGHPLRGLRPLKCRANITEESYFVPQRHNVIFLKIFAVFIKWPLFGQTILKKGGIMPRTKFYPGFLRKHFRKK